MEGTEFDWDQFSVFRKDFLDNLKEYEDFQTNMGEDNDDRLELRRHTFPEQTLRHKNGTSGDYTQDSASAYNILGMTTDSNTCDNSNTCQYSRKGLDEIQRILDRFCDRRSDNYTATHTHKSLPCLNMKDIGTGSDLQGYDAQRHVMSTLEPLDIGEVCRLERSRLSEGKKLQMLHTVEAITPNSQTHRPCSIVGSPLQFRISKEHLYIGNSSNYLFQKSPTICRNSVNESLPKVDISVQNFGTVKELECNACATDYSSSRSAYMYVDSPPKENVECFLEKNSHSSSLEVLDDVFDSDINDSNLYEEENEDCRSLIFSKSGSCEISNRYESKANLCHKCTSCKNAAKCANNSSNNQYLQPFYMQSKCTLERIQTWADDVALFSNKYTSRNANSSAMPSEEIVRRRSNTVPPIAVGKKTKTDCGDAGKTSRKRSYTFSDVLKLMKNRVRSSTALSRLKGLHGRISNVPSSLPYLREEVSVVDSHTTKESGKVQRATGAIKPDDEKGMHDLSKLRSHHLPTNSTLCSNKNEWTNDSSDNTKDDTCPILDFHCFFTDLELPVSPNTRTCCIAQPFSFLTNLQYGAECPESTDQETNDNSPLHQKGKENRDLQCDSQCHKPRRRANTIGGILGDTGRKVRDIFKARFLSDASRCKRRDVECDPASTQSTRPRSRANSIEGVLSNTGQKFRDKFRSRASSDASRFKTSDKPFDSTSAQRTKHRRRANSIGSHLSETGRKVLDTFRSRFSSDASRYRKQRPLNLEFPHPSQSSRKTFTLSCIKAFDNTPDDNLAMTHRYRTQQDAADESKKSTSNKISSDALRQEKGTLDNLKPKHEEHISMCDEFGCKRKTPFVKKGVKGMKKNEISKKHDAMISSSVSNDKSTIKRAFESLAKSREDLSEASTIVNLRLLDVKKDSYDITTFSCPQKDAGDRSSKKKFSVCGNNTKRPKKSPFCGKSSDMFCQSNNSSNSMYRKRSSQTIKLQEKPRERALTFPMETQKPRKPILMYRFPGHSGNCKKYIERSKKYTVNTRRFKFNTRMRKRSGSSASISKTPLTTRKSSITKRQSKN